MSVRDLLTRANINDFLVNFIGIPEDEVALMPDYVRRELVEDDLAIFVEYFEEGI